jgi:hypothetical protein
MRLLALLPAALLGACAAQPFEYHSGNDIRPGPGLFSGEPGAFVFRSAESAAPPPRDSEEYREFKEWREFQEWKRRNKR